MMGPRGQMVYAQPMGGMYAPAGGPRGGAMPGGSMYGPPGGGGQQGGGGGGPRGMPPGQGMVAMRPAGGQ